MCGPWIKKLAWVILAVGMLVVLITLISTVSPLGEQIADLKEDIEVGDYYYTSYAEEELGELNKVVGAAWLSAGVSAVAVLAGFAVVYAVGDIAENVWLLAYKKDNK